MEKLIRLLDTKTEHFQVERTKHHKSEWQNLANEKKFEIIMMLGTKIDFSAQKKTQQPIETPTHLLPH